MNVFKRKLTLQCKVIFLHREQRKCYESQELLHSQLRKPKGQLPEGQGALQTAVLKKAGVLEKGRRHLSELRGKVTKIAVVVQFHPGQHWHH